MAMLAPDPVAVHADLERSRALAEACPVPLDVQAEEEDLERLGDAIAELAARIEIATYRLLVMLREFDERNSWVHGFVSCAHWLNWRTGLGLCAAREQVRVARALANLPRISEAMSRGEVSYSKVRAMTRVATPENEEKLLDFAKLGSAAHLERLLRAWRRADRLEETERDYRRRTYRSLQTYWDEDGMLVVRGRLDPETGAVLLRSLEAAADRLYERGRDARAAAGRDVPEIENTRVDALALVAESALAGDLDPGTRGDRYLVTVHVDAAVLAGHEDASGDTAAAGDPGMAMLEDAVDVSAEASRRLACDCATVTMTSDADGNTIDVGRKRRTVPPAMRRALAFRDRSCRFPGCGATICDAHHIRHWAAGGNTDMDNLLLLCRHHHAAVHEGGYKVELRADGRPRFLHPMGWEIEQAPPPPAPLAAMDSQLVDYVAALGVEVGPRSVSATAVTAECDYSVALEHIRGCNEAWWELECRLAPDAPGHVQTWPLAVPTGLPPDAGDPSQDKRSKDTT
jgi:hypothetical protein